MAMPTLLDIAKKNGSDKAVGLIEEVLTFAPEVSLGAARSIKGLNYKTLVRTSLPGVSFRNHNEGTAATKSTFENRLVEAYLLNPRWECDKAVADADEDGAEAFIALEAQAIMQASMNYLGSQFYYGLTNDAKGFPGLVASYDSAMEVSVSTSGSTANTGSSVWGVTWGPQDVQWILGLNGSMTVSDVTEVRLLDSNNNPYTAYSQELLSRIGLQVGNKYAVSRIKNLTDDSGKGLTDARINQLLEKYPVGRQPSVLFMNRRSLRQLQSSRTATNPTGQPAPFPTSVSGIAGQNVPIVVTDSITNTEALA